METLGDRIRKLRTEKGWSQEKVAEASGVSQGTIGQIETGTTRNPKHLPKIAKALDTTVEYLTEGLKVPSLEVYAFIPRYKVKGAAGEGYENGDHLEIDGTHAFRRDWLKEKGLAPSHLAVIEVTGDSMNPEIKNGDVVLIDIADKELKNGEVYAIQSPDGTRIKRVIRLLDGRVSLSSDNPDRARYPDEIYSGEEVNRLKIIGRKVWRGG